MKKELLCNYVKSVLRLMETNDITYKDNHSISGTIQHKASHRLQET